MTTCFPIYTLHIFYSVIRLFVYSVVVCSFIRLFVYLVIRLFVYAHQIFRLFVFVYSVIRVRLFGNSCSFIQLGVGLTVCTI